MKKVVLLIGLILVCSFANALSPSSDWFDENGNQIDGPGVALNPDGSSASNDWVWIVIAIVIVAALGLKWNIDKKNRKRQAS